MARIKLAYLGGGSTRAPGTMLSLIQQGENFQGSEVVLIDLNEERLELVKTLSQKMVAAKGLDLTVTASTNRRDGLQDCDAVLSSFRPGGFEARYVDESIPLKHGVIGQETQGPGGFFMALRSVHVLKKVIEEMEEVCPNARLFNYTNPVNIVAEAITHHSSIPTVSLCEGPIVYPKELVKAIGLNPDRLETISLGLNHASWTVRHLYDRQDVMPFLAEALTRDQHTPTLPKRLRRLLELAVMMGAMGSEYFQYYYFKEELLEELQSKHKTSWLKYPTTGSITASKQTILTRPLTLHVHAAVFTNSS
jgi:6-phospho-beta-glucosidase